MPRYGNFRYGTSTKKYGVAPRLQYSVDPFTSTATDYGVVQLTWTPPQGDFFGVRIVRNQDGFSETAEDGVTVWEELHIDGVTSRSDYLDGTDNIGVMDGTIALGAFVYYSYWILNVSNVWINVANTYCLMPKSHGVLTPSRLELVSTHDKFMGLLPRVYTTIDENPLGQIDTSSDLYRFLQPFSFTLDEFFTYTDFLAPDFDGKYTDPSVLRAKVQASGLVNQANFATKYQKRLLKNANYIYKHKGTKKALKVFLESMTGYAATVTDSQNIMLSIQDSTFYKGVGNWQPLKAGTLSYSSEILPTSAENYAIDIQYIGKFVTTQANAKLQNGVDKPVTRGIPVDPAIEYKFSAYLKRGASTGNVYFKVYWYDFSGILISTSSADTATLVNSSAWVKKTLTTTSPAAAAYAALEVEFSTLGTQYIDMVQFAASSAPDVATFREAREVYAYLAPSKENYIDNPSFELYTGTGPYTFTGWSVLSGALAPASATAGGIYYGPMGIPIQSGVVMAHYTTALTGDSSFKSEIYPTNTWTASSASGFYTFSIYAKVASGTTPKNVIVKFTAEKYNEESVLVVISESSTTTPLIYNQVSALSTPWERLSTTVQLPTVLSTDSYIFTVEVTVEDGQGVETYFEGAQLEKGYTPSDYFDGDTNSPSTYWYSTPNNSKSIQYVGVVDKANRVTTEITKYLPLNSAYRIDLGQLHSSSGIT